MLSIDEINKLKEENARQKEEVDKLKGIDGNIHPDSAYYKISMLRCKNNKLERQNFDLSILKTKYLQALQEIKEIAEKELYLKQYSSIERILRIDLSKQR